VREIAERRLRYSVSKVEMAKTLIPASAKVAAISGTITRPGQPKEAKGQCPEAPTAVPF
jgi:hypothetical protein